MVFSWLGAVTTLVGIGVTAYSQYIVSKKEEEKGVNIKVV